MNYQQQLANSAAIRAEIQRFESVHPNIYSIYELLERVEEPVLQNQIREHVIAIEGEGQAAWGFWKARGSGRPWRGWCVRACVLACVHRRLPGGESTAVPLAPRGRPVCLERLIVSVHLIMDNGVSPVRKWYGAAASWPPACPVRAQQTPGGSCLGWRHSIHDRLSDRA